jgi:ketosteroid isomerase-like protein
MSEENVELVRRGLAAYRAGDWTTLGEFYDADVVMHHLEGWPEPGPSVGRDAVIREMKLLRDSFEVQSVEITDILGSGDRVVARYLWRGKGSGPDAEMEFSFVFTLRDGKVVNEEHFWNHTEALEAAGLSE